MRWKNWLVALAAIGALGSDSLSAREGAAAFSARVVASAFAPVQRIEAASLRVELFESRVSQPPLERPNSGRSAARGGSGAGGGGSAPASGAQLPLGEHLARRARRGGRDADAAGYLYLRIRERADAQEALAGLYSEAQIERCLRNAHRDMLRRERRHWPARASPDDLAATGAPTPEAEVAGRQLVQAVLEALAEHALDGAMTAVSEGYTLTEVERELGVRPGTLRKRKERMLERPGTLLRATA